MSTSRRRSLLILIAIVAGAGLGYQLASVIARGPAPLIATKILQKTGPSTGISWYIVGCCVLGLAALLLMPRRSSTNDPQSLPVTSGKEPRRPPSLGSHHIDRNG